MVLLDSTASKALSEGSAFSPERKERVISDTLSTLKPPSDGPTWALKTTVEQSSELSAN